LNVRALRFVAAADELGHYTVKPNLRTLGPRFGKQLAQVAAALAASDPARVAATVREGAPLAISVGGKEHSLGTEDVLISLAPLEGYGLEREGSHAVAMELALDDDLLREGYAREIVHAVQSARREAGLEISDRIALDLAGDQRLVGAAREHERYIAREVLALSISYGERHLAHQAGVAIDGTALEIALERCAAEV
ncbi:MAG TPA: DUF5915 domain-containing protein, partial [Solirubrobacteraceae bacterium]|nr:DUF5915 domain-containing protein [Solirubrobacteraceae bacterium]